MRSSLGERIHRYDPVVVEVCGGAAALAWGLYAACDGRALEDMAGYQVLSAHMPDWLLEGWAILGGALQLAGVVRDWHGLRKVAAWSQLVFFDVVGVGILNSDAPSQGAMLYFGFGKGAVWSILHLHSRRTRGRGG